MRLILILRYLHRSFSPSSNIWTLRLYFWLKDLIFLLSQYDGVNYWKNLYIFFNWLCVFKRLLFVLWILAAIQNLLLDKISELTLRIWFWLISLINLNFHRNKLLQFSSSKYFFVSKLDVKHRSNKLKIFCSPWK